MAFTGLLITSGKSPNNNDQSNGTGVPDRNLQLIYSPVPSQVQAHGSGILVVLEEIQHGGFVGPGD